MLDIGKYKKIIIVGSGGSGKSTLARKIGNATGLPVIHLDKEFWQPGWVETPKGEWIKKQEAIISGDNWIIDGNYNGTLEMRFSAAELVIFMDINRLTCVLSAAMRTGKKRADLPGYLTEPKMFSKDFLEFAGWIWKYPENGRKKVLDLHGKYPGIMFLQIKHRKDINKYIGNINA